MKKIIGLTALITGLFVMAGCDKGQSINIVGSSAMQPLVEAASEQYSSKEVGKFINVQGGGSGTGLSQVQSGAVNIGNSDLFAEEKTGIDASKLVDHKVAVVGLAPIVNKNVGIKNISMKDLAAIFTGKITNWKELGGKDQDIVLINRAAGSGSRYTFEKIVLNGKTSIRAQEQDSTGMVRQIVGSTPGAISYVSFYYIDRSVQALSIDQVKPDEDHVKTNAWPIWSYEHMYTKGAATGLTKDFLEYILSDTVQDKLVPKLGYIPISQMKVEKDASGTVKQLKQ
ncbi:phosphate ABC transporter substrate-binding protein PstS family protein [Vagococcus entomophilus]|uniref:Phosphate-binding protein n=1 Tax=Vagococcus entomophilus TaxID=1160095 RepID=A0A430AIG6_9ENTE|nr:phosphate ABC transporter substrate-binding protein PstS family protein [Vagococcus entomophilus]RSU07916.1 phosphate ABC transporter substrate-binding protein [Vagococcus entomophilus]